MNTQEKDESEFFKTIMNLKKENFRVEIRKGINQQQLLQKRLKLLQQLEKPNINNNNQINQIFRQQLNAIPNQSNTQDYQKLRNDIVNDENLVNNNQENIEELIQQFVQACQPFILKIALEKIEKIRRSLCVQQIKEKIQLVLVNQQAIQIMMDILANRQDQMDALQYEIIWIFINLCCGSQNDCKLLINLGILNSLKATLLNSVNVDICENILQCIGNLLCDSEEYFEDLLKFDLINLVLEFLNRPMQFKNQTTIELSSWILSIMLQYKAITCYQDKILKILEIQFQMMKTNIAAVQKQVILGLSKLLDNNRFIRLVINTGLAKEIVAQLDNKIHNNKLNKQILIILIKLLQGDEYECQIIINYKLLKSLGQYLNHQQIEIRILTILGISSIVNHTKHEIVQVLQEDWIIKQLLKLLMYDTMKVKKEILIIFENIISIKQDYICEKIIKLDFLQIIKQLLFCNSIEIVILCLQCIQQFLECQQEILQNNVFENGDDEGEQYMQQQHEKFILIEISKCQLLTDIENLQGHKNECIYNLSYNILDRFFPCRLKQE